jgi:hypothetical protein
MPLYNYTADDGEIHPIRLSSTTATFGGFTADGAATSSIFAKVSKGNREFGLRPRGVRLVRNVGTPEVPNNRYKFLPVATETLYDGAVYNPNQEVTIDGAVYRVLNRQPEDY